MEISGLIKFSLIDYPGLITAVVFTRGCNFRCPFCHNPQLVLPEQYAPLLDQESILNFLSTRVGKLNAVTISGGEPTLQDGLLPFLRTVKTLGFKTKLDTNGSHPAVLAAAFKENLLDFIAMDIKAPLADYEVLCGVPAEPSAILESIDLIRRSGLPHQFRTTQVPQLLTASMLTSLKTWMESLGENHIFQPFQANNLLDPELVKVVDSQSA